MTRKESEHHVQHICEVTGFDLETAMLGGLPTYLMDLARKAAEGALEAALAEDLEEVAYKNLTLGQAVPETAILKRIGRLLRNEA